MKKLIINIGQEAVVGATYEVNGKDKIINRVFEFPCLSYYNNVGAFEFPRMIATIKRVMPRDVRGLDIDLILPTYVTDVEYVDVNISLYGGTVINGITISKESRLEGAYTIVYYQILIVNFYNMKNIFYIK